MTTAAIGLIPGFTGPIARTITNSVATEAAALAGNSARSLSNIGLDLGNPFKVPGIQSIGSM